MNRKWDQYFDSLFEQPSDHLPSTLKSRVSIKSTGINKVLGRLHRLVRPFEEAYTFCGRAADEKGTCRALYRPGVNTTPAYQARTNKEYLSNANERTPAR